MQMRPKLRCDTGKVHLPQCDDCSALEGRVGAVEEDVEILEGKVTQNESDIDSLDTRADQNDLDITNLKTRVTALEQGGVGGGVTHVLDNNGTLDMTAGELMNALGNSSVYLVRTEVGEDTTTTTYCPLIEVESDGTEWDFNFLNFASGTPLFYAAQGINEYPEIPK